MTIDARWAVFTEDGAERGANLLVKDRDQVRELVKLLADEAADVARLIHRDRPLWDTERGFFDHDVYATVRDGFGYLSYQDANRDKAYPEGDPASEGCEFDDDDFPPGSGLPVERFVEVLVEFLTSADRPASVTWRDETAGE
ncbi:Immunity protein Imm1 [Saccharopolyspora kobensis]|uniref:Immunity protein Imm1 n=1 Tax=Saccharopolyspora kobensis TaxID=146035 RepID=A0A1H6DZC8_9PSEU|nr:Imm1 family immunity protein [Saccharopolyspora kobensis]SEG90682.1 Immunity protein Imm1 [Saccharopolyspora kobensis]SFD93177.1 Immunity protein Imm1 [Saccharopolyspora kobensis]